MSWGGGHGGDQGGASAPPELVRGRAGKGETSHKDWELSVVGKIVRESTPHSGAQMAEQSEETQDAPFQCQTWLHPPPPNAPSPDPASMTLHGASEHPRDSQGRG